MCRLFGLSGGAEPVSATFWLLSSPDSLADQGAREPDGTGLGWFDPDGTPRLSKQPLAADADPTFAAEARTVRSRTFLAHVRYATTGAENVRNTHPFLADGRLFAHNGMVGDLPALEHELGDAMQDVHGDTDSERVFALITREIGRRGDVGEGIAVAVATERMDDDPGWRQIPSGTLVHVDAALRVRERSILSGPPAHPIHLSELTGHAAAAQRP